MMISSTLIFQKREQFHSELLKGGLTIDQQGIPAIADKGNKLSIQIARNLVEELGSSIQAARLAGQTSGRKFEQASVRFLSETFPKLNHLRPGKWKIHTLSQRDKLGLAQFQQFTHLQDLHDLCQANRKL